MIIKNQLEKYLNKEVIIEEKLYELPSTITNKPMTTGVHGLNKKEGMITDFDEDFIELDNNTLITRKHIYRITLK